MSGVVFGCGVSRAIVVRRLFLLSLLMASGKVIDIYDKKGRSLFSVTPSVSLELPLAPLS